MEIDDIPGGTSVGLDANVLIFHFLDASPQCSRLLLRCERGDLSGYLPSTALAEALHRLMMIEALGRGVVRGSNPAKRLRQRPEAVRGLVDHARAGDAVLHMGLELLPQGKTTFRASRKLRLDHGLLVNDSLIVATLLEHGVHHLATTDPDFTRVPDLTVVRPTDAVG